MASISTEKKTGRRKIQFTDANRKRQTVRLGKIPKRDAESIRIRVEALLAAQISKQPIDAETARWVAGLDDVLAERLANVGLLGRRDSVLLADFIDAYAESRTDLKPRTRIKFNATREYLVAFFGADHNIRDITAGHADDWRLFLLEKGLAENTVRKHAQIVKQFFTAAVRRKLIDCNPFEDLKSTVQANPERFHFVSRSDAEKILAKCPDAEWRLIFALSRFGGLRCPSEHLALTWDCIDWENERIRIPSQKTEHHAGHASRIIPIFPELRPHLDAMFDLAPEGTVYIINRYRDTNVNLRTQLIRIIEKAGLERWPKLFHNLRSTRETELAEEYPMHVICSWIGNSKAIAAKHYLQVTDEHFEKATQNPTQPVHDNGDSERQAQQQSPELSAFSDADNSGQLVTSVQVAEEGLEPPTRGL